VYEHIEPALPSHAEFRRRLERALAGPGPGRPGEQWLNFLVRDASGAMVGRLEATVHHGLAEVAFLFGPAHWGRGLATAGLRWLHDELARRAGITDCWATTVPANPRCQRLLQRCGYQTAALPAHPLYSYDPGDLVFHKPGAA
jgi:RimJ/RimL family protein N-acetyltransferase